MKTGFLEKIQKLPLGTRKIILFAIVIIIGIVLVWVWSKTFFARGLKGFQREEFMEEFKIPPLKEKIEKDLPKLEIPEIPKPEVPGPETEY